MKFEEIVKNKFKKEEICGSMIYFLTKNDEVVYVGQSKMGMKRISFHEYTKKDFDNFCFINFEKEDLNRLENYYIMKYKPKYNYILNKEDKGLISYTNFYYQEYRHKKSPRLSFQQAKKLIIKNNLYKTMFKKSLYLDKNELNKINSFLESVSIKLKKEGGK